MSYNIVIDTLINRSYINYDIKRQIIRNAYIERLIAAERLSSDLNSFGEDSLTVQDSSYDKILACSCLLNDKIVEIMAMREKYPEELSM